MRFILRRRDCSPTFAVGIFYAQWYHIVPTPVWSVNAPTAVEWCYATGQTEPFFFVLIFKQKGLWEGIVIVSLRVKGEVRLR